MDHWIFELLPLVLPASWTIHERKRDGIHYVQSISGLSLIVSGDTEWDGRRWIHMSIACPWRMPTWMELVAAKEMVIGRDAYAVQVIPPRNEYVNQHPYCLHLFSCIDGHPLPDFTRGGTSL
jgi:hypothetical protein